MGHTQSFLRKWGWIHSPIWGVQGEEDLHAERCLGLHVLSKALQDAHRGSPSVTEKARLWILGDSVGLDWWCSLAGMNKEALRERLSSGKRVTNYRVTASR